MSKKHKKRKNGNTKKKAVATKNNILNQEKLASSTKKKKDSNNIWAMDKSTPAIPKKKMTKLEVWNLIVGVLLILYGISPLGNFLNVFNLDSYYIMPYVVMTLPFLYAIAGFGLLCRSDIGYKLLLGCGVMNFLCLSIPLSALLQAFILIYPDPVLAQHFTLTVQVCIISILNLVGSAAFTYLHYKKILPPLYPRLYFSPLQRKPKVSKFEKMVFAMVDKL